MLVFIIALLTLICCTVTLMGSLMNALLSGNNKIILTYSFLFVIYIIKSNSLVTAIFEKLQECICAIAAFGLFGASNHFVISFDVISLFGTFILIFCHRLKLTYILPAEQSI